MHHTPRRTLPVLALAVALGITGCANSSEDDVPNQSPTSSADDARGSQDPADEVSPDFANPTLESVGRSTLSFGFEDVTDPDLDLDRVAGELEEMGVDTVALAAGRADWTSFAWEGHEDAEAPIVQSTLDDTGTDPFGRAAAALGEGRQVVAVVDVFVGRYLEENPEAAAVDGDEEASDFQVSLTELTDGEHGETILAMVSELASRDDVSAVTLTELQYDSYGLGEDDLDSFREDTGARDWPRTSDDDIDWRDDAVAEWRSQRVAEFVARARDAAHEHGAELLVDVRSPRDGGTAVFGQDYERLYRASDGLVVWHYPGLGTGGDGSSWSMARAVDFLSKAEGVEQDRVVLSVGLWDQDGTLPPDELAEAMRLAEDAGFAHRWVTPYSLLEDEHLDVLKDVRTTGR